MTSEQALKQYLEAEDRHDEELARKEEFELYGMTIAELEMRKPECQPDSAEAASYLDDAQGCLAWVVNPENVAPLSAGKTATMYINRAQYFLDKITQEQRRKEQAQNETF